MGEDLTGGSTMQTQSWDAVTQELLHEHLHSTKDKSAYVNIGGQVVSSSKFSTILRSKGIGIIPKTNGSYKVTKAKK
jgi:hypothetical protein